MLKLLKDFAYKQKNKISFKNEIIKPNNQSVQEWLPFSDIENNLIARKDNVYVAVLKVHPLNISLKSDTEKMRIINAAQEVFNGQREAFQIISLGRPVDLDAYLINLKQKANEMSNPKRKNLLQGYQKYVAGLATGGEILERRFYILLPQKIDNKLSKEELRQRAIEFASNLSRSGLKVEVCDTKEILDLLYVFHNPSQAAFERSPETFFNIPVQLL